MRYLILGDKGNLGQSLVKYVKEQGDEVITYDYDLSTFLVDDKEFEIFTNKVNDCDFCFFLAFRSGSLEYINKTQRTFFFLENNLSMMVNVFSCLREFNKPFIFTSNCLVSDLNSIYGNVKLMGERLTNSLNGVVVRLWNIYGNIEAKYKSHVIPDLIRSGLEHGNVKCKTDGSEERQFLHVDDCAEALYILSKKYDELEKRTIDVTSFEWKYIRELVVMISNELNCDLELNLAQIPQPRPKYIPDEYILKYWQPKISLEEGIKCLIQKMKKSGLY